MKKLLLKWLFGGDDYVRMYHVPILESKKFTHYVFGNLDYTLNPQFGKFIITDKASDSFYECIVVDSSNSEHKIKLCDGDYFWVCKEYVHKLRSDEDINIQLDMLKEKS